MSAEPHAAEQVAERYYDSQEADQFYFNIWGGDDIHIGLYEREDEPIADASRRTVDRMAQMLEGLGSESKLIDVGAGYGGAARQLVVRFGCRVTCLNLSETQNARNREQNAKRGFGERIEVVHGSFESIAKPDESYDFAWSEDALLHSGNRKQALAEVRRVLKPGGAFVFTDPMQREGCPKNLLEPVLARIHLDSLGSVEFYEQAAREVGLERKVWVDLTEHLIRHYSRVGQELRTRYDEMTRRSTRDYVDRMLQGLAHWVEAGEAGHLRWGVLQFQRV
jgi:ubiquinone/menaquinone biosynthesis C-methylase UbiE